MKVLIIGAGLIGQERIAALLKISLNFKIKIDITVVDKNENQLKAIQEKYDLNISTEINEELVKNPDWIFISTPHAVAPEILFSSFRYCNNILVEKPLGRNLKECMKVIDAMPENINLYVGYNYRFYRGINMLLNHVKENYFGDIISVNMLLGHGNSPGMEKSWKLNKTLCGGGCLIDPGVHLLDLALQISNSDIKVNGGKIWKGFWKTGIEEEAHLILENKSNVIFNIQSSLNRWRSNFKLEVNGVNGYGVVEGRGRSYGNQTYRTGQRWGWESSKSQAESEIYHINNYEAEDSFYEEMISLFSLSSETITNSAVRNSDHFSAQKVMKLLKDCRNILKIEETV